jgi:hypothetical protein
MAGAKITTPPVSRPCDGCSLCCVLPQISSLGKPAATACRHLCDTGCGIYPNRPPTCSGFSCEWLGGMFDEADWPGRVGVYVADQGLPRCWSRPNNLWPAH